MGCRSLDFVAVEADLGFAVVASGFGFAVGFGDLPLAWLCHWASRWTRARTCFCTKNRCCSYDCDDLRWVLRWIAVGLIEWVAVMICCGFCGGLRWVCGGSDWVGFAMGLWVFLRWFAVDLRWIAVVGLHLQWFLLFFFFSFYVPPNTGKYFSDYFPKCNQTQENNYFPWNHLHL